MVNEDIIKKFQIVILSVDDEAEAKKLQEVLDDLVREFHYQQSMKDRLLEEYSDNNHPLAETNSLEKAQLELVRMLVEAGETDEQKLTDSSNWLGKTIGDIIARSNNQQEKT